MSGPTIKLIKLKSKFDNISNQQLKIARALLKKVKKEDLKHETNLKLKEQFGNYYLQIVGNKVSNNRLNDLVWQFDKIVNEGNNQQYGKIADFKNGLQLRVWLRPKEVTKAPTTSSKKRRSSPAASSSSSSKKQRKSTKKNKKQKVAEKSASEQESDEEEEEHRSYSQVIKEEGEGLSDHFSSGSASDSDEEEQADLQKQLETSEEYRRLAVKAAKSFKAKLKLCKLAFNQLREVFGVDLDEEE